MTTHDLDPPPRGPAPGHNHDFLGEAHNRNERRTWIVVALTVVMMVGEIVGGAYYGSMALVADGWHMSTHAAALTVAALAYRYARRHVANPRFTFGTGKVGDLAGFASALLLAMVAVLIGWESGVRLLHPRAISFDQATAIAALGLLVNLASAALLHGGAGHAHHHDDHDHDHDHHGDHRDHNLRAAYAHVLADALTSVLAIGALLAGRFLGWTWMDPVIGIVGALVIGHWSVGLLRQAAAILLDATADPKLAAAVRARLEQDGDRVSDLHLWRVGPGHNALIAVVETDRPAPPDAYKARLAGLNALSHVTIEVSPRPAGPPD